MRKEDLLQYKDKKIKLFLKTGFGYTCTITQISEDAIHIVDKFKQHHLFNISSISGISEVDF